MFPEYEEIIAQTVTIANNGAEAITIQQPSIANYTVGTVSTATIAAGGTATFTVKPNSGLDVGVYNATLQVKAGNCVYAEVSLKFTVKAKSPIPPAISTASLPNGTVGTAYSQAMIATGYPVPAWSISSGSLPDGLSIDSSTGAISGIPTRSGTFNFTVMAANTAGSGTKALSITVDTAVISISISPTAPTVKKTKTQKFTADVTVEGDLSTEVVWSVDGATNSTISTSGVLTVGERETASTITVKATAKADSGKTATVSVTVTAAPKIYTLTFNSDGGTTISSIIGIEEGSTVTLPKNPTKESHRFDGWYTAANGGGTRFIGDVTVVNSNITLYAKWTEIVDILGVVLDYNGNPVNGAKVTVSPANGASEITTGADGKFAFSDMPAGVYSATALFSAQPGNSATVNITDPKNVVIKQSDPYFVFENTDVTNKTIVKGATDSTATFSVSATLYPDPEYDGQGTSSVGIYWYWLGGTAPKASDIKIQSGNGSSYTFNNSNGNVPDRGVYKLYAMAVDGNSPPTTGPNYVYSAVATLTVIDFNTIKGVVKKDNTLVEGAVVELIPIGTPSYHTITTSTNPQTTPADGKYQFNKVPDGRYNIKITLPGGETVMSGPYNFPQDVPENNEDITIDVPTDPTLTITAQPQDSRVKNGTAVTLSADAVVNTTDAIACQWYSNSALSVTGAAPISGATQKTYTPSTATKAITYYFCKITAGDLSANTRIAKVDVWANMTIKGTVVDAAGALVSGAIVQLYNLDTPAQTGFTTSTNPQTTVADGKYLFMEVPEGKYKIVVTIPGYGDVEIKLDLPKDMPPAPGDMPIVIPISPTITINQQPQNIVAAINDTAVFSVDASVAPTGIVTCQWYKNSTASNSGGTAITGATLPSYRAATTAKGTAYYYCEIKSNGAATVKTQAAQLTVRNTPVGSLMTIEGVVYDDSTPAAPVTGATVTLSPAAGTSENP